MSNIFWLIISGIALLIAGVIAFMEPGKPRVFNWFIAVSFYFLLLIGFSLNYLS